MCTLCSKGVNKHTATPTSVLSNIATQDKENIREAAISFFRAAMKDWVDLDAEYSMRKPWSQGGVRSLTSAEKCGDRLSHRTSRLVRILEHNNDKFSDHRAAMSARKTATQIQHEIS